MKSFSRFSATMCALVLLGGCSAGISGQVRLVDRQNQTIPDVSPAGIVVNMINTSSSLENASYSVKTDEKGNFKADSDAIKPGTYKIEASEAGYISASKTIELKDSSREVELVLRRLSKRAARSYRSKRSDEDKIINPGEVNIQPPSM